VERVRLLTAAIRARLASATNRSCPAFFMASERSGCGPYSSVSSGEQWRFVQFNNLVIAVQANIVP
jgi:hypothetical protein